MNFFISDIHLGFDKKETETKQEELLLQFLDHVSVEGKKLFIVGDLFDFWFEYRSVIPRRYFHILAALKQVAEKGVKIYYITGNHDFGMKNFFQEDLGIQIYDGPCLCSIDNKRFFITHGDGIAKKDIGYRILKRILRQPILIMLYRILHPDIGFGLANFCSRLSRDHRDIKDNDQEYIEYARQRFKEGFQCVVMGHTHRPQEYHENKHTYINTGDWMEIFSYGIFKNGQLSLNYWLNNQNSAPVNQVNKDNKIIKGIK